MATLEKSVNNLKSFNFDREFLKVIKDKEEIVLDLNTDSQLGEKGIDSTGSSLPGPYRPFTIESKRGRSGFAGITSHITLFQEGNFHNSFFLKAGKFPIEIDASDPKKAKLVKDWGKDIFGLTEESKDELVDHILDPVQDMLRAKFGI
jgi:hypothetical protein